MRAHYLKFPAWLMVLWLISLQVFAPFVHAHPGADGIDHASVMHLHPADSPEHHAHHTNPALENPHGSHQIVSIAQGIPQKIEKSVLADALLLMTVAVFTALLLFHLVPSGPGPNLFHSTRHQKPQPQAPPGL